MAKFLENLSTKFFDFFNFGRFLTIIVPGMIVAFCLAMLLSQIVFPIVLVYQEDDAEVKHESNIQSVVQYHSHSEIKKNTEEEISFKLEKQVTGDFERVTSNFLPLLLATIVIGMILNEISYSCIKRSLNNMMRRSDMKKYTLHPYENTEEIARKKNQPEMKLIADGAGKYKGEVGTSYYAPFLKDKFSGDDNYFDFLVTEYYRFVEFAMVAPISIMISVIIIGLYFVAFWVSNWTAIHMLAVILLGFFTFVFMVLILRLVFPPIAEAYIKARWNLTKGVTDIMNVNSRSGDEDSSSKKVDVNVALGAAARHSSKGRTAP